MPWARVARQDSFQPRTAAATLVSGNRPASCSPAEVWGFPDWDGCFDGGGAAVIGCEPISGTGGLSGGAVAHSIGGYRNTARTSTMPHDAADVRKPGVDDMRQVLFAGLSVVGLVAISTPSPSAIARRPHPLRPPCRIGTACKDISGAILAIVNSQPTTSASRPRLVQRTAVARIRNICSRHSGEAPGRPLDTARTADNNAGDSNVAGSSHSPGRNRDRAHNSQVRNTHNNNRTRRVFVAPRSRRQWLRKQVP